MATTPTSDRSTRIDDAHAPPPSAGAVCPSSPYAIFSECPHCSGEMRPEHAHYRCVSCGWRDSCCD